MLPAFSMAMAGRFVLCLLCAVIGVACAEEPWYVDVGLKSDADALLQFKEGLEDPRGALRSWNYLQSPCAWPGVECAAVEDDATRVVAVEVTDAGLRGSISGKIGGLEWLEVLRLSGNELGGSVPEDLGDCRRLVAIDLDRNSLEGALPVGIVSLLPRLVEFTAAGNKLSGGLEALIATRLARDGVGACESLKVLDLSRNRLTGALPHDLRLCAELVEMHLASNYLVGGVPGEYGEMRSLEVLDLQNNILDSPLPEALAACKKLRRVNVADNFIVGELPKVYVEMRELVELDVARNRLSGSIPPARWSRQAASFLGNDGLCGAPLAGCRGEDGGMRVYGAAVSDLAARGLDFARRFWSARGVVEGGRVRRSLLSTKRDRRSNGSRWGLGIAVGLATGAVAAVVLALLTRVVLGCYATQDDLKKPIIFNKKITANMLSFLEKDDALAGCRLLGQGGNGKVYHVPLRDDLVVAIKCVRNARSDEGVQDDDPRVETYDERQIRAELETLGFIRHRNLVQLLAYIFKKDSHMLVYEFMPGGSLQDALNQMAAGNLTLSWPQRHGILCGVAQGLAYLHNESLGSSIVHRDLKPANILLGDGLEAKLGDFGLAAVVPLKATHASTNVIAGTFGFIAPEYYQTLRYSEKSDVFSFGVVIAQLVTARNPTDQFVLDNGGSIGQWLHKCLQSSTDAMAAIDPALQGSGYEEEIKLAMKIAVFCTNVDPQQRPKSTEALKMLLSIRNPDAAPGNLSGDSGNSVDNNTTRSNSLLQFADSDSATPSSGLLRFAGSESTTTTTSY